MFTIHCYHFNQAKFPFSLPKFDSAFRETQWTSSRYALLKACQQIQPDIHFQSFNDFQIEKHLYLKLDSNLLVSLSHNKEYGAAIVGFDSNSPFISLGIDVEFIKRPVKEGIEKFFFHELDQPPQNLFFKNSKLAIWSAKEAAFKALSPFWKEEKVLVLKDLWIQGNQFGFKDESLGKIFWQSHNDDILIATAFLEKKPN